MKLRLVNVLVLFAASLSASAFAGEIRKGCTAEDVSLVKSASDWVAKGVSDGAIHPWEALLAQSSYLDVQVCAGNISDADYCTQKNKVIQDLIANTKKMLEVGLADASLASHLSEHITRLRNSCR
jgi:hypothetical protein